MQSFIRILWSVACLCLGIIATSSAGASNETNQLYRNDTHSFRIIFPQGWKLKEGSGKNIVKVAVSPKGNATINILVRPLYDIEYIKSLRKKGENVDSETIKQLQQMDLADFSKQEILDFINEQITDITNHFSDVKILEKGVRFLDNRKAGYIKYASTYKIVDRKIHSVAVTYFTIKNGKFFCLTAGGLTKDFTRFETDITDSISSFVFEDWDEPTRDSSDSTSSIAPPIRDITASEFVISFIFTWVIGILPALLLRFVFYRKPWAKWIAISVVSLFYLVHLALSVALGSQSTNHFALYLVAYVSYQILRKGADKVKEVDQMEA